MLIVPLSLIFFASALAAYFVWREITDATAKEPEAVQQALGVRVICALPKIDKANLRLARPPGMQIVGGSRPQSEWRLLL